MNGLGLLKNNGQFSGDNDGGLGVSGLLQLTTLGLDLFAEISGGAKAQFNGLKA